MIHRLSLTTLLGLVALVTCSPAQADTVTLSFPSTDTYYYANNNGNGSGYIPSGSTAYMWAAGDYIYETFTGVGLYSVSSVDLSYSIVNEMGPSSVTWDIYLNGQFLGAESASNCGYCNSKQSYTFTDSFAPIVGNGSYTLEFVLADTVPVDDGAIEFNEGGSAVLTGVTTPPTPLPAALPLFATGLGGLGLLGWRRKRKAQLGVI